MHKPRLFTLWGISEQTRQKVLSTLAARSLQDGQGRSAGVGFETGGYAFGWCGNDNLRLKDNLYIDQSFNLSREKLKAGRGEQRPKTDRRLLCSFISEGSAC